MAFKRIFDNYFNGKPGKDDFTERDLPTTRIQLFKEVLKVRKGSMVGLNLLYILIWVPAIVWTAMNLIQFAGADIKEMSSLLFTYLLILFPTIAITGPFTAGISYVMRNWARDEHSFTFLDFKLGMKDNWKQALIFSSIHGLVPLVIFLCFRYYLGMARLSVIFYLPIGMIVLAAFVWYLSAQLLPTMMVTYDLPFLALLKNSVLISLATLPKAIGIKLLTLILPICVFICIMFFPTALNWLGAIVVIIYTFFTLSLNKLIQASYSNYVCERYLNVWIDDAKVDIGLKH